MRAARRGQKQAQFRDALCQQGGQGGRAELDRDVVGAGPPPLLHRPGPDRKAGRGSPVAACAEDGCGRPAHGRRRARLQQHPDRDHRHHRHSGRSRRRSAPARRHRQADRRSRRTRRQPDQASAGLCPQAAAAAASKSTSTRWCWRRRSCCIRPSANTSKSRRCWPRMPGPRWPIQTSSPPPFSIWQSMRAMRCPMAASSRSRPATSSSTKTTRACTARSRPATT